MTKEEVVAKLREQGHEVTPEEAKTLDALLSTGEMSEADLDKVVGGLDPRFKKALIGAGVLVALVGGGYGIRRLRGRNVSPPPPKKRRISADERAAQEAASFLGRKP